MLWKRTTSPLKSQESGWKEVLSLFFPIVLVLFAGSAAVAFERLCFADHSPSAFNGGVQALSLLPFFQLPITGMAQMTQLFVSEQRGAQENHRTGSTVWHMMGLSLLSMGLILPLGKLSAHFFFQNTEYREIATRYFDITLSGNFLFPVAACLSSFFLAQGRRYLVVGISLFAYGIQALLYGVFILERGLSWGASGGALATLFSKGFLSLVLFFYFFKEPYRSHCQTFQWKISIASLLHYIRICAPRALGKAFTLLIWSATALLMTKKGGLYSTVLSIGSSLVLFCSFVSDSLVQSLSTILSRCLGSKETALAWTSWRFGILFASTVSLLLTFPLLFFPETVLTLFSKTFSPEEEAVLIQALRWVWGWVVCNSFSSLFIAPLLAARDTLFYMVAISFTWLTSLLPVYYWVYQGVGTPDHFWLILLFDQLFMVVVSFLRLYTLYRSSRLLFVTPP